MRANLTEIYLSQRPIVTSKRKEKKSKERYLIMTHGSTGKTTPSPGGKMMLPPIDSPTPKVVKITKEEEERLTDSLFRQALEKKKKSLEQIEHSVYKYEERKVIPKAVADASSNRQCNEELERRKKKRDELQHRHQPATNQKVISGTELESSLQRIYDDAMKLKKERIEALRTKQIEAEKKLLVAGGGQLTKDQMVACADRLCKPSKRSYTDEEINELCIYKRAE